MDIDGTPQADDLDDTNGDDSIDAGAGDDAIAVTNGQDEVDGGTDQDVLRVLWGDLTSAIVNEGAPGGFSLRLVGGPTRSVNVRNVERIFVDAGTGNDNITTGSGDDRIYDRPEGGGFNVATGDDIFAGGAGFDYFEIVTGHDSVDGGSGNDDAVSIQYQGSDPVISGVAPAGFQWRYESGAGRSVNLVGVERVQVFGGSANDVINGLGGNDELSDGPGSTFDNDILRSFGGADLLGASGGHDLLDGGTGEDSASLVWTSSTAPIVMGVAPAGYDIRFESGTNYSANLVGIEHITILGGSGNDVIVTRDGDDRFLDSLSGASGDDYFEAGAGFDYHDIRSGHDRSDGGADFDNASIDWSDSLVPVITTTPTAGYEIRFESGSTRSAELRNIEAVSLYAGSADDVVAMGSSHDIVYANSGNDIIEGGDGDDNLYGEDGADALAGGAGFDNLDGGSGDDDLRGGGGDDYLVAGSGVDTMFGDEGDDEGWLSDDSDSFSGGAGTDTAVVAGQYASFTVRISPDTEILLLASGTDFFFGSGEESFDYNIIFPNAQAGSNAILTVQADGLVAGEDLKFDGSTQQNGAFRIFAGLGNDELIGGAGNDELHGGAGIDKLFGGDGDDAGFLDDDSDSFTGGAGTDTAIVAGQYASFTARVSPDTEVLLLASGTDTRFGAGNASYDYNIVVPNGPAGSDVILTVQATGLVVGEDLVFDGSAQQNGHFRIFAGRGVDQLTGGGGDDGFFFDADANGSLTGADRMNGGGGTDTIALRGNYVGSKAVAFAEDSVTAVEVITFLSGHENPYGGPIDTAGFDYAVTMAEGNVAAGNSLDIIGTTLRANESAIFDGRAETDGTFRVILGAGDDIVFGGQGADLIHGGLGADQLDGSGGADTYSYRSTAESTAASTDSLVLGDGDRIDLGFIDADSGADGNQAFAFIGDAAFGNVAGQLRASQSGNIWIVEGDVDGDGAADLVINVTSLDAIVAGDFIP